MLKKIIGFLVIIAILCVGVFAGYWFLVRQDDFPVFIESMSHGTVTVDGYDKTGTDNSYRIVVERGDSITLNISPEITDSTYYELDRLVINGEDVTSDVVFLQYKTEVKKKLSILAYFKSADRPSGTKDTEKLSVSTVDITDPNSLNSYLGSAGAYGMEDPCIVYDGDTDYFYCFASGNKVSRTKDLVNWTSLGGYFDVADSNSDDDTTMLFSSFASVEEWASEHGYSSDKKLSDATNNRTPFAPDIIRVNGTFYLYFTLRKADNLNESAIFCVKTDNLEKSILNHDWKDVGLVLNTCCNTEGSGTYDEACAANPSVFLDAADNLYMSYGSYYGDSGNVRGGVYLVKLDKSTGLLDTESSVTSAGNKIGALHGSGSHTTGTLIAKPGRVPSLSKNEGSLISGADIVYNKDAGYYYLFMTYGTRGANESIWVARSEAVAGPYTDYNGENMSEFHNGKSDQYDTGVKLLGGYTFTGSYTGGVTINDLGKASTGSPCVIKTNKGWFMAMHASSYVVMDDGKLSLGGDDSTDPALDIRAMTWSDESWPLLSSEPYAGEKAKTADKTEMYGVWDVVTFGRRESATNKNVVENNESFKVSVFDGVAVTQRNIDKKTALSSLSFEPLGDGKFKVLIDSVTYTVYTSVARDSELGGGCYIFSGYAEDGTAIFGKKSIAVNNGLYTDAFYYAIDQANSGLADSYKQKLSNLSDNPTQSDINTLTASLISDILSGKVVEATTAKTSEKAGSTENETKAQ